MNSCVAGARGVLPEFKWSSQHLERGGCDGCSEAAFGSVWARRVAVAWPALGQPGRGSVRRLAEERNAIVGAQGGDALPRPAVTVARRQAVTVEKARDHVVSRDQRQRA